MIDIFKTINIPQRLLFKYKEIGLSNDELILILKIKSYDDVQVKLISVLEEHNIAKIEINSLMQKKVISLEEVDKEIYINLLPLYEQLMSLNELSDEKKTSVLTITEIEKLKYMFNRELKPFELEKIKEWKDKDYNFNEIEDAINKALVKSITNLNYIEAILFNDNSINETKKEDEKIK